MSVVELQRRHLQTVLRTLPVLAALVALPFFVDLHSLGSVLAQVAVLPLAAAVLLNLLTRAAASERNLALLRGAKLGLTRPQALAPEIQNVRIILKRVAHRRIKFDRFFPFAFCAG